MKGRGGEWMGGGGKGRGKSLCLRKFFHFRIENSMQVILGDLPKVQVGLEYESSG